MCIYVYIYVYIYIYYIYLYVYETFNVVLRFFDSRYKVSLMLDLNPRPSDFRFDALPTESASLTQGCSSTVAVYTRSDIVGRFPTVGGASEHKSEGRGFESHTRLTLYLESKNLRKTLNIIYII